MNELATFVKKNRKKLAKVDYEALTRIATQIEALKMEKDQTKKAAAIQAIELNLSSLWRIAQTTHDYNESHTSRYADLNNRLILEQAVGMARKLLRSL
ncbi:MAG TPA: hypothetical protein VJI32_08085 [Candidatus Nanoarchaeia archaeon]|nr:hypothetical protein [Candidatus Nanoarchaeia archaeon]